MFKKIDIQLSGPICACLEQNLEWTPIVMAKDKEDRNKYGLQITCKTCRSQLIVGWTQFVASITCDDPYPGKQEPIPPPPKLSN